MTEWDKGWVAGRNEGFRFALEILRDTALNPGTGRFAKTCLLDVYATLQKAFEDGVKARKDE